MSRPRALMIASAIPATTGNGFAMRLGIFLEALARVAEVDLVVLPVGGSASASYELPARLGVFTGVLPLDDRFDTQFAMLMRIADPAERLAAFRTFGRPSYSACVTGSVVADLRAIGRQRSYDLVHVGRIYMAEAGLAAGATGARLSLDLDEDDYVSQQSIAELRFATAGEAAAGWFRLEADAMDRMVRTFGDKFDRLWIASPEDRDTLAARHPDLDPIVINNAVDFPDNTERRDDGATLLFVGSFGYPPNAEGILWFADEIWPRLKARAKGRLRRPLSTIVIGANRRAAFAALPAQGRSPDSSAAAKSSFSPDKSRICGPITPAPPLPSHRCGQGAAHGSSSSRRRPKACPSSPPATPPVVCQPSRRGRGSPMMRTHSPTPAPRRSRTARRASAVSLGAGPWWPRASTAPKWCKGLRRASRRWSADQTGRSRPSNPCGCHI